MSWEGFHLNWRKLEFFEVRARVNWSEQYNSEYRIV
jgi:hypothetical protein